MYAKYLRSLVFCAMTLVIGSVVSDVSNKPSAFIVKGSVILHWNSHLDSKRVALHADYYNKICYFCGRRSSIAESALLGDATEI
jgi:hypothetical protein